MYLKAMKGELSKINSRVIFDKRAGWCQCIQTCFKRGGDGRASVKREVLTCCAPMLSKQSLIKQRPKKSNKEMRQSVKQSAFDIQM